MSDDSKSSAGSESESSEQERESESSEQEQSFQEQSVQPQKAKTKKYRRIVRDTSSESSDDESDHKDNSFQSPATEGSSRPSLDNSLDVPNQTHTSSVNQTAVDSDIEIPQTDDEEVEEVPADMNRTRINHPSDDEVETDEEDQRRRTRYEAESDDEEKPAAREDVMTMPKAIRKSINPLEVIPSSEVSEAEDSESEDEVILATSSEDEGETGVQSETEEIQKSMKNYENEAKKRDESINDNFNESIAAKLSSTLRVKKEEAAKSENEVIDLSDNSIVEAKSLVSKSAYAAEIAKREKMQHELDKILKLLDHAINLPDGGRKLELTAKSLMEKIDQHNEYISQLQIDDNLSIKNEIAKSFEKSLEVVEIAQSGQLVELPHEAYLNAEDLKPKYTGKVGMKNFETKKALTVEALQEFHSALNERPADEDVDEPPKYLKCTLMKHQLHALKFMRWRETQKVKGGILADDMGLGKTLSTISLILKQLQVEEDESEEESDGEDHEWIAKGRKNKPIRGGTLVICPASLIKQWEMEMAQKVKRGALDYVLFHGPKRIYKPKELAKYDVVVTSYQTIASEHKNEGIVFKIKFRRIVLDEGHVIRNHKTNQSKAVFDLHADRRWVLSGTPVQNKEFDLFAVVKFLRCRPFDDLTYWKNFAETKGKSASSPRVQMLLKSILLRRTKEQLIIAKDIDSLPEKSVELVNFSLTKEERYVYNRLMSYSQCIFAQYMSQNQEKNNEFCYDKDRLQKHYKAFARKFQSNREIANHEILVLLLRLRQSCCHPSLIRAMVERAEMHSGENGDHDTSEHDQSDIIRELEKMNLHDDEAGDNAWSLENEVFDEDEPSSKMKKMLELLKDAIKDGSKAIVVSQWTAHLDLIKAMLETEGVRCLEFNGRIPVKDRNDIVCDFNNPKSKVNVLLLSLSSGGVGLNLVGANYMFIMDLHWNPQLEQQGQDRIYRFGQKKNVKIYKFICSDTIEERILSVQNNKLEVANSALTGEKSKNGNKLTLQDLKALFGME